jgi:hypothetical protein
MIVSFMIGVSFFLNIPLVFSRVVSLTRSAMERDAQSHRYAKDTAGGGSGRSGAGSARWQQYLESSNPSVLAAVREISAVAAAARAPAEPHTPRQFLRATSAASARRASESTAAADDGSAHNNNFVSAPHSAVVPHHPRTLASASAASISAATWSPRTREYHQQQQQQQQQQQHHHQQQQQYQHQHYQQNHPYQQPYQQAQHNHQSRPSDAGATGLSPAAVTASTAATLALLMGSLHASASSSSSSSALSRIHTDASSTTGMGSSGGNEQRDYTDRGSARAQVAALARSLLPHVERMMEHAQQTAPQGGEGSARTSAKPVSGTAELDSELHRSGRTRHSEANSGSDDTVNADEADVGSDDDSGESPNGGSGGEYHNHSAPQRVSPSPRVPPLALNAAAMQSVLHSLSVAAALDSSQQQQLQEQLEQLHQQASEARGQMEGSDSHH